MTAAAVSPPAVVAIGGGHGLAATLRALRALVDPLTAVVSVADDGGSTGRLRRAVDQPAPGDLRKCLVALGDPDNLLTRVMERRLDWLAPERGADAALDRAIVGHPVGNLLIAEATDEVGDLVDALGRLGSAMGARGRVLPATTTPVQLHAQLLDGREVCGQVRVMGSLGIDSVHLDPASAAAPPEVLDAIAGADAIVLGPGSLYTSVLAALAVSGIVEAVAASAARRIYVCNLHPQAGETAGYDVAEHVAALARHGVTPDVVLVDPAEIEPGALSPTGPVVVSTSLTSAGVVGHDPAKLGPAILAALD